MLHVALLLAFSAAPLRAQHKGAWKLIWHDEFNADADTPPDAAKWTYDLGGGGWGNQELEVYTNHPANVFHDGHGHLVIRAVRSAAGDYTSARIKTLGKFSIQYGKIEARIKIPYSQGVWPAFWMLGVDINSAGWPQCGEIDVMENIGKEPSKIHGTIHGPGYSGAGSIGAPLENPSGERFADAFHVFAVEWSPGAIEFFMDKYSYLKITPNRIPTQAKWVYDHSFFLLLNLAVGGSWPGNPDETTTFPQDMAVDWVRVWQRTTQH